MDPIAEELRSRLARNPEDISALAALRAHYQRLGDYPSLVNLVEGWAARTMDPIASAQSFFEAGELAWSALQDASRAMLLYERALERNPVHNEVFSRLLAIYEQAGDGQRIALLFERRADGIVGSNGDVKEAGALFHRAGETWDQQFRRPDRAVLLYRKAFETDASLVPAIYAAREIYRAANNVKAVASLLELEARAESDEDRKVALFRELAHTRADSLDELEPAINALKRANQLAPNNVEVLKDLARIYLLRGQRGGDDGNAATDGRRAAEVLLQLAQKVPPAEGVPFVEQALDAAPGYDAALTYLERVAERVGHPDLLPGRWVAYLAAEPDGANASDRRRKLANAYLEAQQVEYAIACLEWLFEEGDIDAANQLVELYRQVDREADSLRAFAFATQGLPPQVRISRLREAMATYVARANEELAARHAVEILAIDPADTEAMHFLEDHHRRRGSWNELRELLQNSVRAQGLSVELRKQRLRDVAHLSERRLGDFDGAIAAWRAVSVLDPADRDARTTLLRLLETTERWDEFTQVLEREASSTVDQGARVELFRKLAALHRERRNDRGEEANALRQLLDASPRDVEAKAQLADALVALRHYRESVPLLRERLVEPRGPAERLTLLKTLAVVLEEQAGDDDGAFDTWMRVLDFQPADAEALARLEAIDERKQNHERLLRTLGYRADLEKGEEKARLLVRMGQIAEHRLGDLGRAADLYHRAFEVTPKDEAVLDALVALYEKTERYRDLIRVLRERAKVEEIPVHRAILSRRIARVLVRVGNEDAAAEAYTDVLEAGEDYEAILFFARRFERRGDFEEMQAYLERAANVAPEGLERRERMLERATILADMLERRQEAIELLRRVVREIDPTHLPALGQLGDLCETIGDLPGLAEALERTLLVVDDPRVRGPLGERLANLYQNELPDAPKALAALEVWEKADPENIEPLRRLVPLYEDVVRAFDADTHPEDEPVPAGKLVELLDRIVALDADAEEVGVAARRAAEVVHDELHDVEAAWARLAPRAGDGDELAEALLVDIARNESRGADLVAYYAGLASRAGEPDEQKRRFLDAARAEDELRGDPTAALELALKAFAVDLGDLDTLAEVDRFAMVAMAYPRLTQVYDTLLKRTEDRGQKVELLLRHAALLETARDDAAALERLLRAGSLAPLDDRVVEMAERVASRIDRVEDVLVVYDRRRKEAGDDGARTEALLQAARISHDLLLDRERSMQYLAQSVALGVRSPALFDRIEQFGRGHEVPNEEGAIDLPFVRLLVEVYAALAEDMETNPRGAAVLLARAASLLSDVLHDHESAYGALVHATTLAPFDEAALDALEAFARRLDRVKPMVAHLAKLVDDALDSKTTSALLRRRARILEELGRLAETAEAYTRLRSLNSTDAEVRALLRGVLRKSKKYQDLLLALENDLRVLKDPTQQLELRKEIARTWERDLKNRWEALESWQKVQKLDRDDDEARAAVERLEKKGSRSHELDADELDQAEAAEAEGAEMAEGELEEGDLEESDFDEIEDADEVTGEPELTGEPEEMADEMTEEPEELRADGHSFSFGKRQSWLSGDPAPREEVLERFDAEREESSLPEYSPADAVREGSLEHPFASPVDEPLDDDVVETSDAARPRSAFSVPDAAPRRRDEFSEQQPTAYGDAPMQAFEALEDAEELASSEIQQPDDFEEADEDLDDDGLEVPSDVTADPFPSLDDAGPPDMLDDDRDFEPPPSLEHPFAMPPPSVARGLAPQRPMAGPSGAHGVPSALQSVPASHYSVDVQSFERGMHHVSDLDELDDELLEPGTGEVGLPDAPQAVVTSELQALDDLDDLDDLPPAAGAPRVSAPPPPPRFSGPPPAPRHSGPPPAPRVSGPPAQGPSAPPPSPTRPPPRRG